MYYDQLTILYLINTVFVVSLLYIMVGALMFVTRGGFFDGITLSFRRFMKKGTNMGKMMDEVEYMDLPSEAFEYTFTESLLVSGLLGFLITIGSSFLIF